MLVTPKLFQALKSHWDANNLKRLIVGGYHHGDPPEGPRTLRPYIVMRLVVETNDLFTNLHQYGPVSFEVAVIHDDFDLASGEVFGTIDDLMKTLPRDLGGGAVITRLRGGNVRYEESFDYWQVTKEYDCYIGKGL